MNYKTLVKFVLNHVWMPLLQGLIAITLLLYIYRSWLTIVLTMLVVNLVFKLFKEVPEPKEWLRSIIITVVVVSVFYWLVYWLGAYGLVGSIVILFLFAGWRIYEGWFLFDAITTWGAERLKGKHKKNFDIEKVKGGKL